MNLIPVEVRCKNAIDCLRPGLQPLFPLSQAKMVDSKHCIKGLRLIFKSDVFQLDSATSNEKSQVLIIIQYFDFGDFCFENRKSSS